MKPVRFLLLTALAVTLYGSGPAAQQSGRSTAAAPPASPRLQGFNVTLVEGDLQGTGSGAEGLPQAASKALADMKEVLPYKSYRVLDSQWISGSNGSLGVQLRGDGGDLYELKLESRFPVPRQEDAGTGSVHLGVSILDIELQPLIPGASQWVPRSNGGQADRPAPLIQTSLRMELGETVVVGTSRARSTKAVIVLLTAVGH